MCSEKNYGAVLPNMTVLGVRMLEKNYVKVNFYEYGLRND